MRVILTDNFTDGPSGLLVRTIGIDTALVHCVQDATVNGLQAVAHIGKGARGDDRHRILNEGLLHFLAELGDLQLAAVDILPGSGAALYRAKALLEFFLIIFFFVVRIGIIGVGIPVLPLLRTSKQTAQIVGHALRLLVIVIVHILCHVLPPWLVVVTFIHAAFLSTCLKTSSRKSHFSQ